MGTRWKQQTTLPARIEVLSLTFHESKIVSRSDPVLGWRVTPYAYFLLKCRGPEVDSIPPLSIDLDFLDTSGYVVLPISTSALPIDASKPSQARPVRDLKVALTLDERTAEEEDSLHLDVKASGHGLIPPLEVLLDLPPAGFTIADTEDRELLIEELDAETDDGAPLSTHEWRVKLVPEGDRAPKEFTFPSVQVETAGEEGLTLQRYEDVDLVSVPATVTLGARMGLGFTVAPPPYHSSPGPPLLRPPVGSAPQRTVSGPLHRARRPLHPHPSHTPRLP